MISTLSQWAQSVPSPLGDFWTQVISLGGYGLLLALLLTRQLVTRGTYEEAKAESAKWHQAYENERQTRIEIEGQKDVAVEAALATNEAFEALRAAMTERS